MASDIVRKADEKKASLITKIDDRIASAETPTEAEQWMELRAKALEQAISEKEAHYKWAFALLAFAVGSAMSVTGHDVFGIFAAGAGLSLFAKDWVMAWLKGGQQNADDGKS